ncbi:MAG: NADH-ubiquinone oxidoreductase-F iron-sulfur binding region domain-containing protein, partial [Myxococcota bacterium]|nr:NADH-ubiquinone oxidoreductase-F iron-sulfur binding region domain-containing protein [Myxococcota bacterium]
GEDYGQGVREDRALKAVIPGGSSCPILMPDEIDVAMDFDALRAAGSLFGTGGVIVMDEQTCMVRVAANLAHFYHVESCGQCTPCREGAGWMRRLLEKFEHGTAQRSEIDLVLNVCDNIEGHTICPHGDALAMVVRRIVQRFRPEFEAHVAEGGCSFPEW